MAQIGHRVDYERDGVECEAGDAEERQRPRRMDLRRAAELKLRCDDQAGERRIDALMPRMKSASKLWSTAK